MAVLSNSIRPFFPSNTGGVLIQVDGTTPVDNVFVFSDGTNTFKWTPNFRGIYHLSQAKILAGDSTDKTSILQTIFNNVGVQTVVVDAQQVITVNGALNCGGKKIVFENGGRFAGTGTISNFGIVASYEQWIFSTTINIAPISLSTDMWSVKWFGAVGTGLVNDAPSIQRAIDTIILLQDGSHSISKTLYYPPGTYRIDSALLCFKWNGVNYTTFTLNMIGQKSAYFNNDFCEAKIVATHTNTFAIGYQFCRSSTIEGLIIQGQFAPITGGSDYVTYVTTPYADWKNLSSVSVRDEPNTPYGGIVVEPFDNTGALPVLSRYPGLESYYRGNGDNATSGSSGLQIKECKITGFIGGIVLSPNGETQNAENIHVIDCTIQVCKAAYISCQDQVKDNFVIRCISWDRIHTCVDSLNYGIGTGQAPYIDGWNIAGDVIQLYQVSALRSQSSFKDIFAEGVWRIGSGNAGTGLTIQDSTFNFNLFKQVDDVLILPLNHIDGSRVVFSNCTFRYVDGFFDKKMIVSGPKYVFRDCEFDLPPLTDYNYSNEQIVSATFVNCTTAFGNLTNYASGVGQFTGSSPVFLAYGKIVLQDGGVLSNSSLTPPITDLIYSFDNGGYQRSLNIGSPTITVDTATRTAALTGLSGSDFEYQIAIGDYVVFGDGTVVGKITAVNRGAGSATISSVPVALSGVYSFNAAVIWNEVITGQFIGTLTSGSATINACEFDTIFGPPYVGQRLKIGHDRYNLIVDAVGTSTVTMSKVASYSQTNAFNPITNTGSNNPMMQITSLWYTPDSFGPTGGTSNFTPFIPKGAICYTKVNGIGNGNGETYVCTKAGYMSAATVGKTNQAQWTSLYPIGINYTPTLTGVANVGSSTARPTLYKKTSNTVEVTGELDVTPTAGSTLTRIGISLPFASNLANSYNLNGIGSSASSITADTVNDRAELSFTSTGTTLVTIKFSFTYIII